MIDNSIESLTPEMQKRVRLLLEELKTALPNIVVFETRRTEQRQAELYALGRNWSQMVWAYPTKPNYWCYAQARATKRTWTIHSRHLRGEAVDFAFKINGQITWSVKQKNWDKLIELGKKYGLKSLAPREMCHLELLYPLKPLIMPTLPIPDWGKPVAEEMKTAGIENDPARQVGGIPLYELILVIKKMLVFWKKIKFIK